MIPVPNQKLAVIAWSHMEKADCHPCGVLVYSEDAHSAVSNYMRERGMENADSLFRVEAGDQYAFIATAIPTATWRAYAEARKLFWWQWFGQSFKFWQDLQITEVTKSAVKTIVLTAETETPTEISEPKAATGAAVATTESTTEVTDEIVNATVRELLNYPDDPIGSDKHGQQKVRGRLHGDPRWMWYYEGPYNIAKLFRIDTRDVPCLKVRVSFQNKSGQRFHLDGIMADRMQQYLQDLATSSQFVHIVQGYRS